MFTKLCTSRDRLPSARLAALQTRWASSSSAIVSDNADRYYAAHAILLARLALFLPRCWGSIRGRSTVITYELMPPRRTVKMASSHGSTGPTRGSPGGDLTGYTVVAVDGDVGHVEATYDSSPYLEVGIGSFFGREVILPAGARRADRLNREEGVRRPYKGPDQGRAQVRQRTTSTIGRAWVAVTPARTCLRVIRSDSPGYGVTIAKSGSGASSTAASRLRTAGRS